jgi:hypothetical protein
MGQLRDDGGSSPHRPPSLGGWLPGGWVAWLMGLDDATVVALGLLQFRGRGFGRWEPSEGMPTFGERRRAQLLGRLAARYDQGLEACPFPRQGSWGRVLRFRWMLGLAEASGADPAQLFYRADWLDKLSLTVSGVNRAAGPQPPRRHLRSWACA